MKNAKFFQREILFIKGSKSSQRRPEPETLQSNKVLPTTTDATQAHAPISRFNLLGVLTYRVFFGEKSTRLVRRTK
jgi:hypothetical protein